MSHAANLRNRQRPTTQDSPAKRRRIEPAASSNGINAIVNGTSADKKFIAIESTDVKRHTSKAYPVLVTDTKIGHGEQEDASMLDAPAASGSEEEDDEEEGASSDSDAESADSEDERQLNGDLLAAATTTPTDLDADSPTTEPSFGDLLRARAPTQIIVEPSTTAINNLSTTTSNRALTIPTATSLGTVLTQALRTNDIDLLESCLQVANLDSIRATIERLHSSLATSLLHKLAERLHRRPGRAGSLMVWVQWTIVAHGGYLASQPTSVKQLHTLYNVVKQRAAGLQPLLTLKGKLDMLEAQMRLRQSMQDRIRPGTVRDQDEAGVVYVEGEEDVVAVNGIDDAAVSDEGDSTSENEGEDSEVDELAAIAPALAARAQKKKLAALAVPTIAESDDQEDDDDMPDTLPNGVDGHDDGEGSSDDDDDAEGLLDDEAEESGDGDSEDSELDEEDIDYDDEDLIDDDSSEGEEGMEEATPVVVAKPVKVVKVQQQRKGGKRK